MDVEVTNVYSRTRDAQEQTVVNMGGAGSSKSHSVCQFSIFNRLLVEKGYKTLVLRKIRHACKLSIYKFYINLLPLHTGNSTPGISLGIFYAPPSRHGRRPPRPGLRPWRPRQPCSYVIAIMQGSSAHLRFTPKRQRARCLPSRQ